MGDTHERNVKEDTDEGNDGIIYAHMMFLFLKTTRKFLPSGVSGPSFNLRTISVCPSMRNLGGLFLAEQRVNRYPSTK